MSIFESDARVEDDLGREEAAEKRSRPRLNASSPNTNTCPLQFPFYVSSIPAFGDQYTRLNGRHLEYYSYTFHVRCLYIISLKGHSYENTRALVV